eukprot:2727030-Pleurochrysis_carterae.AAC.3
MACKSLRHPELIRVKVLLIIVSAPRSSARDAVQTDVVRYYGTVGFARAIHARISRVTCHGIPRSSLVGTQVHSMVMDGLMVMLETQASCEPGMLGYCFWQ